MNVQYKDDIRSVYKPVARNEQKELFHLLKDGDSYARESLINSCLPLVCDIAHKFHFNNKHIDIEDMIQNGNIALIRAVDNWDGEKNSLTTVVTHYVNNELIDMIKDSKYKINNKYDISRRAAEHLKQIKKLDTTDVSEIKDKTGMSERRIKLLMNLLFSKRVDYSLLNPYIKSQNEKSTFSNNVNGCLADLVGMVNEHIVAEKDKEIFSSWLKYINKNNKTKLVSKDTGYSTEEISDSVKATKRKLREIFRSAA